MNVEKKCPLISVIIPVYNSSKYLKKCIESVQKQTYPNIEIILVDDGSTDESGLMCDDFQRSSEKIRVIHKKNEGQAAARNDGIKEAKGEYIGFVDSDDWVSSEMYEILYKNAVAENAQISCCGIKIVKTSDDYVLFNSRIDDYCVFTKETAILELLDNKKITCSPCDKLYKKEILKNTLMAKGRIFEDFEVMPKWLHDCDKVVYIGKPLYNYRANPQSTMTIVSKKRLDEVWASNQRVAFFEHYYPQYLELVLVRHLEISMNVLSCTAKTTENCKMERTAIRSDIFHYVTPSRFKKMKFKGKIKFLMLCVGLNLFDKICGIKL